MSHQHSSTRKKRSYIAYMLFKKIPLRFGILLVPQVILSVLLSILVRGQAVSLVYEVLQVLVLFGFWALTWQLAKRNRHHTHRLRHYYICNLAAYALFLLVAVGSYWLICHLGLNSMNQLYELCFRLPYVFAFMQSVEADASMLHGSMAVFYGITLALILSEPPVSWLMHRLRALERQRKGNAHGGHHSHA